MCSCFSHWDLHSCRKCARKQTPDDLSGESSTDDWMVVQRPDTKISIEGQGSESDGEVASSPLGFRKPSPSATRQSARHAACPACDARAALRCDPL